MAIATYFDTSCLIAMADAEPQRAGKAFALLRDQQRTFIYSPFTTLETLSLAIHYRNKAREQSFRNYLNVCTRVSDLLTEILNEAQRQSERYGIVRIDACHIAAAVVGLADEFYTFEKATKPMFRTREIKVISLL
ncbi:MAG: type II toxin-antitoxin system VapC family toxin [Acidobacteriota bacterium]